ncbi:MAG: thioredoxin family protein [Anaerolineaceae bacterium]|nr:thioredoxin family protein [Anaerolineaceae bacterium]
MNDIELLYFDGCPSWQTALENLHQVIEAEKLPYQVRLIEIANPQQAQEEHFLGSPSFRINGLDLWPETRTRYNMSCRVYQTDQGMLGSPTVEMLRERIRKMCAE